MTAYSTGDIRNMTFVGHSGSGKTSLCEAIMHATGVTSRMGSVDDKTSHLDVDDEEKDRGHSIDSHVLAVMHRGKRLNLIDTPGAPDFIGPAVASFAAVETAAIVINAPGGIQVNTRRMREQAKRFGLGRVIIVNHFDAESADLEQLVNDIKESFGQVVAPINLPAQGRKSVINCLEKCGGQSDILDVEHEHTNIIERVSECDDVLMNRYFEEGDLPIELVKENFVKAVRAGTIVPLLFTDAKDEIGIKELLDFIVDCCPCPLEGKKRFLKHPDADDEEIQVGGDKFVGQVFKVAVDHKSKIKYPYFRVLSGSTKADKNIMATGDRKGHRPGHFHYFVGGDHKETDEAIAGDLVAVAKMELNIGDTLFTEANDGHVEMPKFPQPMYALAVEPKARGDEGKLSEAIHRFTETDPCFKVNHDPQTHELVISGNGDMHLRVILSKMARQFKLEVDTKTPKIPYRETISKGAEGHYRHKKQTGGAGQFGEVYLKIDPLERGSDPTLEWAWDIFGGSIPGQFEPAIKKGVTELMEAGPLAGFPMQDVKVSITDGKHHPVDSKEVAFKAAGKLAFKDAVLKSKPVLLEPIVNVEVTAPTDQVGDITGDLAQRRGRPTGQDLLPGNMTLIEAQVPLAKLSDYHSRLSSMTGGKGSYALEFSHYEPVPSNEAQAVMAQYQPKDDDDE